MENTSASAVLIESLNQAKALLGPVRYVENLAEEKLCSLCRSDDRDHSQICVVIGVTDVPAMERAGVFPRFVPCTLW